MGDTNTTARVIALVNQKGGCGKTTTAVNLAACVAVSGRRVLLIDLDPQANATMSLGVDPGSLSRTIYSVLADDSSQDGTRLELSGVITPSNVANLDLAPSSIDLAAAEMELSVRIGRENVLRKKLAPVRDRYDCIFLDTPPSLGLLTLNALVACEEVIIPIQTHFYAFLGVRQLLRTLKVVREEVGHEIEIAGVVPTMYDARTIISKEIVQNIHEFFGDKVFTSTIHFDIKLVESGVAGVPVFIHNPSSRGAQEYMGLAKEVMALEHATRRAGPQAAAGELLHDAQTTAAEPLGTAGAHAAAEPPETAAAHAAAEPLGAAEAHAAAEPPGTAEAHAAAEPLGTAEAHAAAEPLEPAEAHAEDAIAAAPAADDSTATQPAGPLVDAGRLTQQAATLLLPAPHLAEAPTALLPPAGARAPGAPGPKMVGVVDFCAPIPLETSDVPPQRLAANDLADLLTRAAEERFAVIPRATVQQAELAMKWRDEDVLSIERLGALARAVGADWLVVGWIPTLQIQPEERGTKDLPSSHRRPRGEASVVVRLVDTTLGRVMVEVRQWVSTDSDVRSMLVEQVLHRALEPTVSRLITMLAA